MDETRNWCGVGGQGFLHFGAEEQRVLGDDGGHVGAGEAEAGKEGEDGVGIGGGFEVGELGGGLEGLGSGEAARVDEVLLDGEARVWGSGRRGRGRGEEAVERGDVVPGGIGCGRREEMGEDAASEAEHGGAGGERTRAAPAGEGMVWRQEPNLVTPCAAKSPHWICLKTNPGNTKHHVVEKK